MTVYRVSVAREDGWWMIGIPALHGLTQARRLADVQREAADYITVTLDVNPSSVEIIVDEIRVGDAEVSVDAERLRQERRALAEAQSVVSEATEKLVAGLLAGGVPMRDIADLTGVSYQRVGQLKAH